MSNRSKNSNSLFSHVHFALLKRKTPVKIIAPSQLAHVTN